MVPSHGHYGGKIHFLGATRKLGPTPLHTPLKFNFNGMGLMPFHLTSI